VKTAFLREVWMPMSTRRSKNGADPHPLGAISVDTQPSLSLLQF